MAGGQRAAEHAAAAAALLERESKLVAALQELSTHNDAVIGDIAAASREVLRLAASQGGARQQAAAAAGPPFLEPQPFGADVMAVLKRNADQLLEMKKQRVADTQASKQTAKRLMLWASGQQPPPRGAARDELQADAVRHGRFRYLPLAPGGSVAAGGAVVRPPGALRFWQTGLPSGAGAPRSTSDTPSAADQQHQQQQKTLTDLLFGKRRWSSAGGVSGSHAASHTSRRGSTDAGASASWRSSADGRSSRRASNRSSEGGGGAAQGGAAAAAADPAGAAAALSAQDQERSTVLGALSAGEGPLSKSHAQLAKPGLLVEQQLAVGRSLACVAEDEQEGRDSPLPGAARAQHQQPQRAPLVPPPSIRVQLAGGNRATSPIESFSFGNWNRDEPHSPNFLRGSVSSRVRESRAVPLGDMHAGPLVRSSVVLQAAMVSRVDPFDAPEPQPQPFVEQMRAEDQAMRAGQAAQRDAGMLGALRRSVTALRSGAASAGAGGQAAARLTPRGTLPLLTASGMGPLTGGGLALQQQHHHQYQHLQQQQQVLPPPATSSGGDADGDLELLDLEATQAYAMSIHQVMGGLAQGLDQPAAGRQVMSSSSGGGSRQESPRLEQLREEDEQAEERGRVQDGSSGAETERERRRRAWEEEEEVDEGQQVQPQPQMQAQMQVREEVEQEGPGTPQAPKERAQADEPAGRQERGAGGGRLHVHVDQLQEPQVPDRSRLAPPSPALSPQPSSALGGPLSPPAAAAALGRSVRPANGSAPGSRRQSQGAAPPPAACGSPGGAHRPLPAMGQASIDILGRVPPSLLQHNSKQLASSSGNVRLTDVYNQTSGVLTPLAAGLSSIQASRRTSSGGNRQPPARRPSAGVRIPGSPHGMGPGGALLSSPTAGPLAQQYGSMMQSAKRAAQAAGLAAASPRDPQPGAKAPAWGWQALGLPTGPGAPLADPATDPYSTSNKYAASWGLADAAGTAAGLSRQNSALPGGALSRQPSGLGQASARQLSPRGADDQQPQQQQQSGGGARPPWQQRRQQSSAGGAHAAGGHAEQPLDMPAPGSGGATPGHADGRAPSSQTAAALSSRPAMAPGGGAREGGAQAGPQAHPVDTERRASDGSDSSSGGYASADDSASAGSGFQTARSAAAGAASAQGQPRSGRQGGGGGATVPAPPPAFLQHATSAQAAVAAQWSPSKNAAAIAQAPAYTQAPAYALMGLSPEGSGLTYGQGGQGLSPAGMPTSGPWSGLAAPSDGTYAGHGWLGAVRGAGVGSGLAVGQQQQQQQQQRHVLTAVDLARASRGSVRPLQGSLSGQPGQLRPPAPGGGGRTQQAVALSTAAAGKAALAQRRWQYATPAAPDFNYYAFDDE